VCATAWVPHLSAQVRITRTDLVCGLRHGMLRNCPLSEAHAGQVLDDGGYFPYRHTMRLMYDMSQCFHPRTCPVRGGALLPGGYVGMPPRADFPQRPHGRVPTA
jgi:hypothetical protein